MSNKHTIEYEVDDLLFEFTPAAGFKGDLAATAGWETITLKVDLNSPKGRSAFIRECRDLYPDAFALDDLAFRRALNDLATHVGEEFKIRAAKAEEDDEDDDEVASFAPEVGSERYDAAMEILTSDDVLEAAAKTMLRLGHVGEWKNKKLAFISAVSARAGLPVQPSTHAQSSAGKNHLWDTVLALIPPELVYKRTGFSAKALFRTQMSLKHSILYIQELAGSEGADFSIRTLQSDNVLKWEATEKQADGTLANVEYEVEGPTVIVQTTRNHLHPENETRVVPIYLDETAEQTERITKEVLRRAAGKGAVSETERETMCEAWHDVVRLLEPAEVIVPFAERIKVPTQPIRLRRDVPRLISIIRLVAWVHQHTRERGEAGRVLATEDDFDTAIGIAGDSFARAWKSLIPSEEKVYEACKEYIPGNLQKHGFKRSHVENALRKGGESLSLSTVKDCLYTLSRSGFLESDGKRGVTGATYTLAGASTFTGRITLAGHSAIREKAGESRIGKATSMAESDSGPSRPFGYGDDTERPNGQEWPKATRPLKMGDLQEQHPNGRMADENPANTKNGVASKTLFGDGGEHGYEYTEDE